MRTSGPAESVPRRGHGCAFRGLSLGFGREVSPRGGPSGPSGAMGNELTLDELAELTAARPGSARSPSDRKSTRLNSSHGYISYAVFCLKKKKKNYNPQTHPPHTLLRVRPL